MPAGRNKYPEKDPLTSKEGNFISVVRFIVSIYRGYLRLHFWSIAILLLIILLIGDFLTTNGLLLVLGMAAYLILPILDKWLEKQEKK